jgi:hypothetical protein
LKGDNKHTSLAKKLPRRVGIRSLDVPRAGVAGWCHRFKAKSGHGSFRKLPNDQGKRAHGSTKSIADKTGH